MNPYFPIDVLSRIFHVGTAICLAGGSVYGLFVLLPALRASDESQRIAVLNAAGRYWKRFVMGGTLLLLITGFYNYFRAMPSHDGDGLYHALVGVKILSAFAVFFLAAALVGKSASLQRIRDRRAWWHGVMLILLAGIIAISGFLKVRGVPAEVAIENAAASAVGAR